MRKPEYRIPYAYTLDLLPLDFLGRHAYSIWIQESTSSAKRWSLLCKRLSKGHYLHWWIRLNKSLVSQACKYVLIVLSFTKAFSTWSRFRAVPVSQKLSPWLVFVCGLVHLPSLVWPFTRTSCYGWKALFWKAALGKMLFVGHYASE